MASLETLPAPLPLYITKELVDLISLDSLRHSSPFFNVVFRRHAVELVEHLMGKALLNEVAIEFRVYTLLLLQAPGTLQTEEDFHGTYAKAETALDRTIPVEAVSRALGTFSLLAAACNVIMRSKLARLRALPHEHLGDVNIQNPDFKYASGKGMPYPIPEPSPPNWVEQQSFIRAALRMRIAHVSGGLARELALDKISSDPATLAIPGDIPPRPEWFADQIEECTESFRLLTEAGTISTDHGTPIAWEPLAEKPPLEAEASPVTKAWRQTLEWSTRHATDCSKGFNFFQIMSHRPLRSPLYGAKWEVMRHLGFDIWSERRLVEELGLMDYPREVKPPSWEQQDYRGTSMGHYNRLFTWYKVYEAALAAMSQTA